MQVKEETWRDGEVARVPETADHREYVDDFAVAA